MSETSFFRPRLARTLSGLALGLAVLSAWSPPAQAGFFIVDLGSLRAGGTSRAVAINNLGQVAGYTDTSSTRHAFFWSAGQMTDLGTSGASGATTEATGINDSGTVSINEFRTGFGDKALSWRNGALTILSNDFTAGLSNAQGIDSTGRIVGRSTTQLGGTEPSTWASTTAVPTQMIFQIQNDLSSNCIPWSINSVGQVVGVCVRSGGTGTDAFIYQNGAASQLANYDDSHPLSFSEAINVSGTSVGYTYGPSGQTAATWNAGQFPTLLQGGSCTATSGAAISASGQFVGGTCVGVATDPYLEMLGPELVNLNTLVAGSGWTIQNALGINDKGQIVGVGLKNGVAHAFLMSPSFSANVNFQTSTATAPPGYVADSGAVFANRGNGFSYGWSTAITGNTRQRNASLSPDKRYDTLIQGTNRWEIAVPNGTYLVHIVAGDPSAMDSQYAFLVEGTFFQWGIPNFSGIPNTVDHWFEGTNKVTVTDGRLTITNASWAKNNKLSYIDIVSM